MPEKPNFLILFPDQQRHDTIHAAGFRHMKTPNLDRLVREGCLFSNAYSPNPVCVPARHYLMTGTTGRDHGYFHNVSSPITDEGIPTLPQMLSDHGYTTAAVGKMHFLPPRRHHGFDEMHLMEELPHFRAEDAYAEYLAAQGLEDIQNLHGVRPYVYHHPQCALVPWEHHGENWVGKRAVEFLKQNGKRPFFLMCGWVKPHPPWNIPAEWQGHYDDVELPEPIPRSRAKPFHAAPSDWFGDHDSPELRRQIRAAYYTSVSMVDRSVGDVLAYLDHAGLMDNTVIIFASDHGEMLQDKGFYQKALPYESAARIPFVVRYPKRFAPGTRDTRFVDLLDILPTALDLAGIDYNYKKAHSRYRLAGDSVLTPQSERRDRAYQRSECGTRAGRWVCLRDNRYKYVYSYNGGLEQFYDLQSDPSELHNLAGTDRLPQEDFRRIKAKCVEMEELWGPEGCVVNGACIAFPYNAHTEHYQEGSKFPFWANHQFQVFQDKPTQDKARRYVDEIHQATADCGPAFLPNLHPDPTWAENWLEQFRKFGGDDTLAQRVLGKP